MSYVLAIDVGTSFTAAAVVRFHDGAAPVPECLPLGLRGSAVPSVVYYPEEGPVLVGEAAERRGLDSPGRVVREFKRRVGDAVPISVGMRSLPAEDVFATMARWVADRATEREAEPPSEIILTHPAAWGAHRTSLIKDALAAAGLGKVTLLSEPEAAALHYASQVRVEAGSTIAVYDLGGGTFDTAVLRKTASNRFELLGRPEGFEDLGGADFDAALFRFVAENTGGALAELDTAEPGVLAALARLRRECVEAKEALSSDSEASISVLLPGIQQQVRLVRPEFEALIEEHIRDTVDALEQSLGQLELGPPDLTAVLLIGGSSRIPLVAQLISEQLDRPIAVDADPKSSICLGAAVSAVLGQPAPTEASAAVDPGSAGTGGESPQSPAPESGHIPVRVVPWSRNATTAPGSATAAARGPGSRERGGAHAPKPRVRLTAIAATAALFTVLSATAAQSPEGFSGLTSVFVPPAGASDSFETLPPTGTGGSGTGPTAAAAADARLPVTGIEASGKQGGSSQAAALGLEAGPTSRLSAVAAINNGVSAETSAGGAAPAAVAEGNGATETAPGAGGTTTTPSDTATTGETPPGSPSETPSATPSETSSGSPSETPSENSSGSPTGTPSGSQTGTPTGTASGSQTGRPTGTSTRTASGTSTGTASGNSTGTASATPTDKAITAMPATDGSPSPTVQDSPSPTVGVSPSPLLEGFPDSDQSFTASATTTTPAA
ncbi:Hsp70 family protein [Arthrobacter sp. Alg241-R88]|uniref:Hsp70 family protein n=1 Tax=Arthrobacter sp. Alg241-R88 TaxID=2305984 RepID=UPI0013D38762|nr:Hsp70 family protein [Arthrobacter sp. Alg241-R88]